VTGWLGVIRNHIFYSKLQELVDRLDRASKKLGLVINIVKTKVMATQDSTCNIKIEGTPVEQVDVFTYLGSLFTHDDQSTKDTKVKLVKQKPQWQDLKRYGRVIVFQYRQKYDSWDP